MNWLEIDYPDDLTAVDFLGIDWGGGGGAARRVWRFYSFLLIMVGPVYKQ